MAEKMMYLTVNVIVTTNEPLKLDIWNYRDHLQISYEFLCIEIYIMAAVGKFEDMSGSRQMVGLYW
jgi:hypothetical protein